MATNEEHVSRSGTIQVIKSVVPFSYTDTRLASIPCILSRAIFGETCDDNKHDKDGLPEHCCHFACFACVMCVYYKHDLSDDLWNLCCA